MNAPAKADSKGRAGVLAAQVREAAQVSLGDVVEAERLAGLVVRQLKSAGLDQAAGLHSISPLEAVRLTDG